MNFWGGEPETLEKQGRRIRGQNSSSKFAETFASNFPKFLGPEAPRDAAVKKINLVHRGKCRGFFVKFFAAIFPGN